MSGGAPVCSCVLAAADGMGPVQTTTCQLSDTRTGLVATHRTLCPPRASAELGRREAGTQEHARVPRLLAGFTR